MEKGIIENIAQKTGVPGIVELLATRLTGSELNSLLLEVFNAKVDSIPPALLLKQYMANRFVQPAETDMIDLLSYEIKVLESLKRSNFQPIELSPVAQLGSCSVVATVDQKKVLSATRNTEILADATNSIALHIASLKKSGSNLVHMDLCTVHRHIRTQAFKGKGMSSHFKISCMVSSGKDTGSYLFEATGLMKHFLALKAMINDVFGIASVRFKLQRRDGYPYPDLLIAAVMDHLSKNAGELDVFIDDNPGSNNYYKGIQFKMIIELNGMELEIADGGFVNWTQQLLGNKKERLLISGFGFELLYKFQNGLV